MGSVTGARWRRRSGGDDPSQIRIPSWQKNTPHVMGKKQLERKVMKKLNEKYIYRTDFPLKSLDFPARVNYTFSFFFYSERHLRQCEYTLPNSSISFRL